MRAKKTKKKADKEEPKLIEKELAYDPLQVIDLHHLARMHGFSFNFPYTVTVRNGRAYIAGVLKNSNMPEPKEAPEVKGKKRKGPTITKGGKGKTKAIASPKNTAIIEAQKAVNAQRNIAEGKPPFEAGFVGIEESGVNLEE